jgi:hypothetical protein
MALDIVRYSDLADEERNVVHESYNDGWLMCHMDDMLLTLPKREKKLFLESHEEARKLGIEYSRKQWERASKVFPDGQNVLLSKDNGKSEVGYHIRSNIIDVPGFTSLSEWIKDGMPDMPEDWWGNVKYAENWYEIGDNWEMAMLPISLYKTLNNRWMESSYSPNGNILVNFAVTNNPKVKAEGGLEKLVNHQLEKIANERDILCHTFTPFNDYKGEEVEDYLQKTFSGEVISPVGIHTYLMAKKKYGQKPKKRGEDDPEILKFRRSRVPLIFPQARLKPDALDICGVTVYTGPGLKLE